jgi:Polyketide cyclase / dehydrase and lipid transport
LKPLEAVAERVSVAPIDALWPLVEDIVRLGRFSPEFVRGEWLGSARSAKSGARFRGFNRWGPLRWSTDCEIVELDAPRRLVFDARHWSGATTRWSYELKSRGEVTTIIESFETIDSPALIHLLDRLSGRPRRLRSGMAETVEALSRQAEQDARSTLS